MTVQDSVKVYQNLGRLGIKLSEYVNRKRKESSSLHHHVNEECVFQTLLLVSSINKKDHHQITRGCLKL